MNYFKNRVLLFFFVIIFFFYCCRIKSKSEGFERLLLERNKNHGNGCWYDVRLWPSELIYRRLRFKTSPPNCSSTPNWLRIFGGKIYFRKERNLTCTAQEITLFGQNNIVHGKSVPIGHGDDVPVDAFMADCFDKSTNSKQQMLYGGVRRNDKPAKRNYTGPHHNIILLCMDSVSRLEFERSLPKTVAYFKSKNIGGQVLESYNIVGDGTTANLGPLLTGKNRDELPEVRRGHPDAHFMDDDPWIFKRLHHLGYTTQWFEEQPRYGTFTYRNLGFMQPPVEHYMRAYMFAQEKKANGSYCIGSELQDRRIFGMVKELFRVYNDKPKFSLIHLGEFSHDGRDITWMDDHILEFMQWMVAQGVIERTMFVLFADHGARYSYLRRTTQGRLEERLPMMGIALPKNLYNNDQSHLFYANLKENVRRLSTPYDLHATMQHLLNISSKMENSINTEVQTARGASFLRPINVSRTCFDAEIQLHWCACSNSRKITTLDHKIVKDAAAAFINVVNDFTKKQRKFCHFLSVKKLISADFTMNPKNSRIREIEEILPKSSDLQIGSMLLVLTTNPNDALYEVTVYWYKEGGAAMKYYTRVDYISRTNGYGSQPKCVMDAFPHLRLFCLCKQKK